LVAPVGVGTSSRVYLAVDAQLRRRVAVKLLHEALAADDAFLRRFRAEARAAGALSHPNIVAVYDWGEDETPDGVVPYLVTEYLAGGSLRGLLDAGHRLTPSQALVIGLDAARALEHAHLRGLVHRDVKPGNLLFDEAGRLRLADFGLARALAEASWTEPSGTTVGTARYASPEQALGRRLDGHSDVYSLALVLVECVTGSVPLTGETTASTLALRTQGDLPVAAELAALRGPLERAGRLDPAERPDAGGLAIALMAAAERLPRPEPLPLTPHPAEFEITSELRTAGPLGNVRVLPVRPDGDAEDRSDDGVDEGTGAGGSGGEPAAEGSGGDAPAGGPDEGPVSFGRDPITVAEEHHLLASSRPAFLGPVGPGAADEAPVSPASPPPPARRRAGRGRRVLAAVGVLALLAGGAALWWFVLRTPTHEVPAFVGDQLSSVRRAAERNGWRLDADTRVRRDGTDPGEVLAQRPRPGADLEEGRRLGVTVSLGPTLVVVPGVAGTTGDEARAALEGAGLVVGSVTEAADEEVPAGSVVSATVAGGVELDPRGRAPKGTTVDLVLSSGPAPRTVPDGLVGVSLAEARARLAAVQLTAAVDEVYDDGVPAGVVIRAGTEAGTAVPRDSAVALVVSRGPAPVPVPDVAGQTGTAASAALEAAGFRVSGIEGSPSGRVLATDPPAGEAHQRGTAVRIFTRR
jgi:serine/threonine-protein kinase